MIKRLNRFAKYDYSETLKSVSKGTECIVSIFWLLLGNFASPLVNI